MVIESKYRQVFNILKNFRCPYSDKDAIVGVIFKEKYYIVHILGFLIYNILKYSIPVFHNESIVQTERLDLV